MPHGLMVGVLAGGMWTASLIAAPAAPAAKPDTQQPVSQRFADPAAAPEPSYQRHVLPLMSKVGCSGRACHGSFQGQGGFQLSLFGYDFKKDHAAMTAGDEPRVDLKDPANSLVLRKPTLLEKHKGKKIFDVGSWQYNIIHGWIRAGAVDDSGSHAAMGHIQVLPAEIVFKTPGESVQLRVLAHWQDGSVEDVTDLTRFRTSNEAVARVDEKTGVVTSAGGGDTHVVAFYDNGVAPAAAMLPVSDKVGEKYPRLAENTEVDRLIGQKLRKLGVVPSELCDDLTFLRRVRIDMTGSLPTAAEVRAFVADPRPDKRARKIDELLQSPEYAAWWTTKLCDITGNNSEQLRGNGNQALGTIFADQWRQWIHRRVAENVGYDKIVEGIALGRSRLPQQDYAAYCREMASYLSRGGEARFADRASMPYFYQRRNVAKPEEKALAFAYAFLGVRLACAECHKHPFDQWTQEDFKSFQAFFAGVGYRAINRRDPQVRRMLTDAGIDPESSRDNDLRRELVQAAQRGKVVPFGEMTVRPDANSVKKRGKGVKDVRGNSRVITPRVLGGEEVVLANYDDPRQPLMDWMRSEANPYFARAWVNRVWAHYLGVGIIDPADDLNLANPPSNAALLDHLAAGFIASGYDMKQLHRTITTSQAYQRSWKTNATNATDRRNFSHALLRRIPAEVAFDAIAMACAGEKRLSELTADMQARAIGGAVGQGNVRGNNDYPLLVFGKPDRLTNCDCERSNDPTLLQSLFLYNDTQLHRMIDGGGWITDLQRSERAQETAAKITSIRQKLEAEKNPRRLGQMRSELAKLESGSRIDAGDRAALVTELYLRTLGRMPAENERREAVAHLASDRGVAAGMRDLLWVMLNTKEFIINH